MKLHSLLVFNLPRSFFLKRSLRRLYSQSAENGPIVDYNKKIAKGFLKEDAYQRGIIMKIQNLYENVSRMKVKEVVVPSKTSFKKSGRITFGDTLESSSTNSFSNILSKSKSIFTSILKNKSSSEPSDSSSDFYDGLPKGLYLWGDVGCGKTMLMDLFYNSLKNINPPIKRKRIHFNAFMQNVHKRIHAFHVENGDDFNCVPIIAANLAQESTVLCFDELQVTDVGDAMLLRTLIESLINNGVILFITSNRIPDDLYINGIQRDSFIPCIEMIKKRLNVICLNSPIDYRKVPRPQSDVYFYTSTSYDNQQPDKATIAAAQAHTDEWFNYFSDPKDPIPHKDTVSVWGRSLIVPKASGHNVAQFSFDQLCVAALSASDYLAITSKYKALIVTDIPFLTTDSRDMARRFILLVDAMYESHTKFACNAAAPFSKLFVDKHYDPDYNPDKVSETNNPELQNLLNTMNLSKQVLDSEIFTGDEEKFAFARALSRLSQMSSTEWLEANN